MSRLAIIVLICLCGCRTEPAASKRDQALWELDVKYMMLEGIRQFYGNGTNETTNADCDREERALMARYKEIEKAGVK